MSHIDSIFELLDTMAQEENKEELNFSMVFEPIQENGNRRSNLTNITFKFKNDIENIKFVSAIKHREDFLMDIQNYPINVRVGPTKSFLLFKEFNNKKIVELSADRFNNSQLQFPNNIVRDYHQKIFPANNATNVTRSKEVQILKDYIKLPSISFISEDPFLFLNIYKYLEEDNLQQYKTKFNFNYSWNSLLSNITQTHQIPYRFFEEDSIMSKALDNWNIFDGYNHYDNTQFIFDIKDSKVIHQSKIVSNINYNYTQNINMSAHHKKLMFLPAAGENLQELSMFGSNQYIINIVDHGFIFYSPEKREYSYSGIFLKDLPNLFLEYSEALEDYSPGIPKEEIAFVFKISLLILVNTLYCIQSKDIEVVKEKIIFELMQLSKLILDDLISKAPKFFEDFTLFSMNDLSINVSNSLFKSELEESDLIHQELDNKLSISTSKLLRTHKFFSMLGNNHENAQILREIPNLDGNQLNHGCFVNLMSYIQKQIEPDEEKHLNLEQLNLSTTFKFTHEHFIFKEKIRTRLETRDLPQELWKLVSFTKKLDLVLVDDTPLKAKKIKYLTKNPGTKIIMFKDMIGEFYFRSIEFDKFKSQDINIRWLSEITFTDGALGKTESVINTSISGWELKEDDALLKYHQGNQNLSYMVNRINMDLEEFEDISIVSILVDKNFNIAKMSDAKLASTIFQSSSNSGIFYNSFSNFIKKIVKEKYGKEVKIVFNSKSMHSKLIKSGAIDFLSIKNSNYYGRVQEIEKNLAGRYQIDPSLVNIYTYLTFDIIRRSRIKVGYESDQFYVNINGTFKDIYINNLAKILTSFTEKDKIKDYPFVNFFINKGHPIISLAKARPVTQIGNINNTKITFGIDILEGKTKHSFIDINTIENKIMSLLFSTKEFQKFQEETQDELGRHYGTLDEDDMNQRLAQFKMGSSNHDVINYLLNYDYGPLPTKEDYQEYLLTQFNNILITRFKYQLNLKNETIIELFKLFRDFDKLIIENYKDFYYGNTGIKLEAPDIEEN